ADKLLMSILKRARYLASKNMLEEFTSPALAYFVKHDVSAFKGISDEIIANYVLMEDNDILMSLKYWQFSNDRILADLSKRFLNRQLFRATFSKKPFSESEIANLREKTAIALQ